MSPAQKQVRQKERTYPEWLWWFEFWVDIPLTKTVKASPHDNFLLAMMTESLLFRYIFFIAAIGLIVGSVYATIYTFDDNQPATFQNVWSITLSWVLTTAMFLFGLFFWLFFWAVYAVSQFARSPRKKRFVERLIFGC